MSDASTLAGWLLGLTPRTPVIINGEPAMLVRRDGRHWLARTTSDSRIVRARIGQIQPPQHSTPNRSPCP